MKLIGNFTILFLFTIILFNCSSQNTVKIIEFEPQGKVERLTTFTVEFSEDLAPADMQHRWLDDEFIEFEPKIEGKFKWTSPSTLLFSPDFALKPIQKYEAKITKKVLFNSIYKPDFDTYEFSTPDFEALRAEFFWTRLPDRDYTLTVKANMYFNYAVVPDQLKQYMDVLIDGEKIDNYEIVSEESSEIIAINFDEIKQADKKQDLEIVIKEGLESVIGRGSLEDERSFKHILPEITRLAITKVTAGFDNQTGWVEVATTQTVDQKSLADYVSFDPPKEMKFFVNENRFRIEADIVNQNTVNLKINKGLPGLYGGELEFDYEQIVTLVNLDPSINFTDKKGKYLMLTGERNLELSAVNVPAIDIEVSQVFKNNLIHFLGGYEYYYNDYDDYYSPNYYPGRFGKRIYTEKIELSDNENWLNKINVNLDKALNQKYKGIYVINARSSERRYTNDSKMIAISDLGIITKKTGGEIIVFINSLKEAKPVAGVDVSVISRTNQTLLNGLTDQNGVVHFKNIEDDIEGFTPRLIVAELGDDFNYIDLRETNIETSRFDVGGITQYSRNYTSYIYSERNLYRPGETINLSGIVRDDKINLIEPMPVIVKLYTPTGKVFDEYKKTLNEEGSFEIRIDLPDYAQTGEYSADVFTGSKVRIGSYKFSVEEFVPDKIRVQLSKEKDIAYPGEKVPIKINAEYLFGAKGANLKYESTVNLSHRNFYSKKYPRFNFSNNSFPDTEIENYFVDGNLDSQGEAEFAYIIPSDITGGGSITGTAFVSVFDLTGRTVSRAISFDVYPKKYFVGIKADGYYFGTDKQLSFQFVTVDEEDKVINDFDAKVELIKYEWQTVLKKDRYNKYYYGSEQKEIKEWDKYVTINGVTDYSFSVSRSGRYELRVYKAGQNNYVRKTFYAYGWGRSTASTFEVDKEGRVDIVFDKEIYEPGDEAKVLFTTPFSGKLLVTLERNGVYDYQFVDVTDKSTEVKIPVSVNFMPNVYVSATLFKPHEANSGAPFLVGHGYASMKVEKSENKLSVSVDSPKRVKPRSTQKIKVKTLPQENVYVTIAAVDEGILQVKNYKSPDPHAYMYAKKPLKVDSYDLYKLLLPEIVSESSTPGGGDALMAELEKRSNPIKSKRFKLVSFWSGIKKTNSNGEVTIDLNIPQYNGDLRIMAVAYTGSKFGSASANMKVADDIIMQAEIPRFLSQNDSLVSNISLINTTDKDGDVNVDIEVEGPVEIVSDDSKSVEVEANSSANVTFALKTNENVGPAKISISISGYDNVKEEIDIAVRPLSPFISESGHGTIKAGAEVVFDIPDYFLEGTQHSSLTLSKFPAVKLAKHLKYLVGYPHGCIEQTVSKLFPQLYFDELAKLVAPEIYRTNNPVYFVNEGIKKIESMQMYDGSMSYWQGGSYSSWWGSVYAAHFLVEAQKAGFNISQNVMSRLLNYLSNKVKEKSTTDYVRYYANRRTVIKIAPKETIYSLYILALAGKGDLSTMNYYKARPNMLSNDMKYLLAGAYGLMEEWNSFYEVLPPVYEPEKTDRLTGGSFDSEVRANAIMLNVLLEVKPDHEQIPFMIKHITKIAGTMYSTQERSFAFLALGKAAKANASTNLSVDIIINSETKRTVNNDYTLDSDELNRANVVLKGNGTGEMYYFWNTEGIKIGEPVKEEDNLMQVRRTYYDYRTKQGITNNKFKQGQLIVCKVSLTGYNQSADNIVITDMLPTGFEIENPRLSTNAEMVWKSKNRMNVQYMDVRDDRLLLFTNLWRNRVKEFYYMLRVVNKGTFSLPVISAEAMYDKEYNSTNGAGKVVVN